MTDNPSTDDTATLAALRWALQEHRRDLNQALDRIERLISSREPAGRQRAGGRCDDHDCEMCHPTEWPDPRYELNPIDNLRANARAVWPAPGAGVPVESEVPKYKAGDPDPSPYDDGTAFSPRCDHTHPNWGGQYPPFCTLAPGHAGDHVAGDGLEVLAVWPQTPPAERVGAEQPVPVEDLRADEFSRGLRYPDPKDQ